MAKRRSSGSSIQEFYRRAKEVLSAAGGDAAAIWGNTITDLEVNNQYSRAKAVVGASKEYPVLIPLLVEFDLLGGEDDPDPNGKPVCEDRDLPYIDAVRWAVAAAGESKLTGKMPRVCPSFTAWYLYEQAMNDPNKFVPVLNTTEGKAIAKKDEDDSLHRASRKSIEELDRILEGLEGE